MSVVVVGREGSIRDEVVQAGARLLAGQYRVVHLVTVLDASREWAIDGAPTCAHWIAAALDTGLCTAREWLRIGRALAALPVIDGLFEQGKLSYSKVRALTRVATAETEAELCELAERLPANRLPCALAAWRSRRETPEETEARQHELRSFWWRTDVDGMIAGSFRLEPAKGAALTSAVDAIVRSYRPNASADASLSLVNRWPSIVQQRADAFVRLVHGGGPALTAEVVMHVRGDGCSLDDGTPIAGSVVERIAPNGFLRAVIHDAEGRPINASGRHRHPTVRQRRVVRERDRRCVDCGSTELLDCDHVPPFEVTQRTVVDELQVRCAMCHHARHHRERVQMDSPAHESGSDA
jgi:hypothetical protein